MTVHLVDGYVKRFASRGRTLTWKKWILLLLVALLLIPAMQVAVVRFRVKAFASRGALSTHMPCMRHAPPPAA